MSQVNYRGNKSNQMNHNQHNHNQPDHNKVNHIIAGLQDYMFTSKNMSKSICYTNEEYDCKIKEKKKNKCHKRLTIIEQKDHLLQTS